MKTYDTSVSSPVSERNGSLSLEGKRFTVYATPSSTLIYLRTKEKWKMTLKLRNMSDTIRTHLQTQAKFDYFFFYNICWSKSFTNKHENTVLKSLLAEEGKQESFSNRWMVKFSDCSISETLILSCKTTDLKLLRSRCAHFFISLN